MEKEIYAYDVPLKDIAFYIEPIKKHFGLYHPTLEPELLLLDGEPDRTVVINDFVPSVQITELIDKYFTDLDDASRKYYVGLFWLVANLYYGECIRSYENYFNENIEQELIWEAIRTDLLAFFAFMQDHKESKEVTIKFGKGEKNAITLQNDFKWFQGLMVNQLFPNTIPEITDKKEAKAILRKQAGRPSTRKEVNAIVNGVASSLSEYDIIQGKAPIHLLRFIRDYLVAMDLIKENDPFVTTSWIKSQISNIQKPGKDPKLFTTETKLCSMDDLKDDLHLRGLNWLLPHKVPSKESDQS